MASASTESSTTAASDPNSRAQAEARAAVLASLESAGSNHDSHYQLRAKDLHSNSAAIAKQEVELKKQTAALAKENAKWQKEVDRATKGLNEIGDVQNWAEVMEREFCVLEETLRLVEGGERVEMESGGNYIGSSDNANPRLKYTGSEDLWNEVDSSKIRELSQSASAA